MARAQGGGRRIPRVVTTQQAASAIGAAAASQDSVELARPKFACPACGGEAVWNPAKGKLICPFCGTESPAKIDTSGTIVEHDLVAALRAIPDASRGWQMAATQVRCQSCNAISVLDASRQAQSCPFCGSAQLVPYSETKAAFRPEAVLPFAVSENVARDGIRAWYGRLWLAPSALVRRALTDTVRGVYLPYWTFDAQVEADWTAEAGHYYYETQTVFVNGQPRTQQVQRIRWEPAAGHVSHFFDDDLVCASVGVQLSLVRGIEPFPTHDAKPYDPAYLSGWIVERYQIDLVGAAQRARADMDAKLIALCASRIRGDTYRNLAVRSDYSGQTFKHILAPAWLLSYTYGARRFQCVLNGVTGRVSGQYPKSPWKIALLVLAIIIVIVVVMTIGGRQ
ncbi:MAG TPA: TFIIB-type zinc ribbon-containing protein [Casimicrobiaceae bacterium]|nr:TFIIB-type zinc ribbon-containing protein [Casimicrobiaceae bacterium]